MFTALIVTSLVVGSAWGQPPDAETPQETSDAVSYWERHVSIHGHLSLGYAELDAGGEDQLTADDLILGLEEGGAFPYWNGALNLRYEPALDHELILQLAASDLGDSPADSLGGEIEVDWLFYQYRPSSKSAIRLGRQPAPAGLFNEVRDVGVLLPFFRPAFTFYREGALFSETVDGLGVNYNFRSSSPWSLEAWVYYGEFTLIEQGSGFDDVVTEVDASDALGAQLWLNTPISGLRFGLGALRWDVSDESAFSSQETTWRSSYASLEGDFEHFVVRAEFRQLDVELANEGLGGLIDLEVDLYYWQLGWLATDKLSFYVQPEFTDITQNSAIYVDGSTRSRDREDLGFAINYAFSPMLVLKAEYHQVKSEKSVGTEIIFGPQGPTIRNLYGSLESNYTILSLAMSF